MLKSNTERLEELCRQKLSNRRLILASNRGPIDYHLTEDKQLQFRRGSGGVVTALNSICRYVELDWVACAMGAGDRQRAQMAQGERFKVPDAEKIYLRFVLPSRSTYYKYYSVICNPLLWFLQHYMWNTPTTPNIDFVVQEAWDNGYVEVNQAFAKAIIDEVEGSELPPIVILNDYHLYLAGTYIRRQLSDLVIQHFIHIPWPAACYWQLLPASMRQAIVRGLCAADIVGLQTMRDVHNFRHCCDSFIEEAEVDYQQRTVKIEGHPVQVKTYPISVDVAGLKQLVTSDEVREYEQKFRDSFNP